MAGEYENSVAAGKRKMLSAQVTVTVPGTSDPWLAGEPNGTVASGDDSAPGQSPAFGGFVTPGSTITWSASGSVANGPTETPAGPNGDTANVNGFGLISHATGAENGISDVSGIPIDALMGVFIGPGAPSGVAPGALDFGTIGLAYGTLSPALDQVFYMGDGSADSVVVPAGATRLYLGPMDGFEWNNNPGSFEVTLNNVTVPDASSTLALLSGACALIGVVRRKLQ